MSALNAAAIDAAAKGSAEDMRSVLNGIVAQLAAHGQAIGVATLEPVSGGRTQTPNSPPPKQAALSVTGANGVYTVSIANAAQSISAAVYHEVSFAEASNFSNAIALPVTPSTGFTYPAPGANLFWRLRSSYDRVNFNAYTMAARNGAVAANFQSSAATENNVPLNQTNFATIDSQDGSGGSANVRVFGAGGPGFMYPAVKGDTERILPSATVVHVAYSSNPVIAFDGAQYQVRSTLSQVFEDSMIPTGSVSVVGSGAVVLPTVALVLDSMQHVIAWNVLTHGNGLTAPVTLHINTSGGSGATPGAQTISGGKLMAIAAGNPGTNYNSADTVTVTGGVYSGQTGGGGDLGGNGGRFIYNDGTTN